MNKFQNFNENTMRKVLDKLINYKLINNEKVTSSTYIDIREIKFNENKKNNPNLTPNQIQEAKKQFENDMAFLYLKTFYRKSVKDFSSLEYKEECCRLENAIKNSPQPQKVKQIINQAILNKHIDYQTLKKDHLFKDIFYSQLKRLNLSSNSAVQDVFPMRKFITDARIYINPSMRYYEDLLNYIYSNVAEQELCLKSTHKLNSIATHHLDNLVLYTDAKSFPYIVNILENYGRSYPRKVAEFGSSLETTAHTRQAWFGAGFEYYWDTTQRLMTFNDVFQEAFNEYIIPCVLLDDFLAIIDKIPQNQQYKIFSKISKDEKTCKALLQAFKDRNKLENFYRSYINISEIAVKNYHVEQYIKNNIPLKKRNNIPETKFRSRGDSVEKDDMYFLATETLPIQLNNKSSYVFNRYTFSKILLSPEFREAVALTYNTEKVRKNASERMLDFYNYFGKHLPYCDPDFPLFSKIMTAEMDDASLIRKKTGEDQQSIFEIPKGNVKIARRSNQPNSRLNQNHLTEVAVEDYMPNEIKNQGLQKVANFEHFRIQYPELTYEQNLQLNLIQTLSYSNGRKLLSALKTLSVDIRPLKDMKMQDVQRVFMSAVGINEIIKAHEFSKTLDSKQFGKIDFRYEKALNLMQSHRVKSNINLIYSLPPNQRMEYIQGLTKYEYKELMNVAYFRQELERINDNLVRTMSNLKK